jgi:Zn-dependent M28 family amino/carboxypeptidase
MRQSTRLPVLSFNGPRWLTGVDWSDHRNYWRYGWPAAMVTDSAFYRNRAYHTAGDTAQRLDFRRLAQVIEGVAGLVVSSDQR